MYTIYLLMYVFIFWIIKVCAVSYVLTYQETKDSAALLSQEELQAVISKANTQTKDAIARQ